MLTRTTLVVFSLIFSFQAFGKDSSFLPKGDCEFSVEYTYYSMCYSVGHRQALWTKHELTVKSIRGPQKRINDYKRDSQVPDSVGSRDYRGSGFDRGHLVPAADMKLNRTAMVDTFFMTNMSPQKPEFNRRIWSRLEKHVRGLVLDYGDGHVVTAPYLEEDLKRIRTGVSIPDLFYKIIYIPEEELMAAWIIGNRSQGQSHPNDFLVTVDEIEELTGLDFFSELPDALENRLEAQIDHH